MEPKNISSGELLLNIEMELQYDSLISEYNRLFEEDIIFQDTHPGAPTLEDLLEYDTLRQRIETAKSNLPKGRVNFVLGKARKKGKN